MPIAIQDTITLVFIFINIILTLILIYIYIKNYRAITSKVTLGLFFFAMTFLLENVMDFYFYTSLLYQSILGVTAFNMSVNFIEMIGLILLLWITWK